MKASGCYSDWISKVEWLQRQASSSGLKGGGTIADIVQKLHIPGNPTGQWEPDEYAKRSATVRYSQKDRQVLTSQLNGKNKLQAIAWMHMSCNNKQAQKEIGKTLHPKSMTTTLSPNKRGRTRIIKCQSHNPGPQPQTMQSCPGDYPAQCSRM